MLKELYAYREMIAGLIRKDLRGRYKGSVLGFLWTFINPLLQLAVYTIVFSTILKSSIDKYYLFLFVALVPWIFFSSSITAGSRCVINEKSMVTKIYFPRQVLPISCVTSAFVNMLLCFIVVFIVVFISGIKPSIVGLLCLPIVMLSEYVLALGIAMVTSALTVYFRDLEHILGIITMAWVYLTPIMYSIDFIPEEYINVFLLNPMTPIIIAYRDILYYGTAPLLETLIRGGIFGLVFLVFGYFLFSKLTIHFAEEL